MTTYVMEAKENYAPAFVADFDMGSKLFLNEFTYQDSPGASYDYPRRVITYMASTYNANSGVNPTGVSIWSGQNLIAPGGTVDFTEQMNLQLCTKSIDAPETVTFYNAYNASHKVPNGLQLKVAVSGSANGSGFTDGYYTGVPLVGGTGTGAVGTFKVASGAAALEMVYGCVGYTVGDTFTVAGGAMGGGGTGWSDTIASIAGTSDGTYQRFVESEGEAFPQFVDPRTGNIWFHVDSFGGPLICTVYMLRLSDDYQQVISPLLPIHASTHMEPIGLSDAWFYVIEDVGRTSPYFHLSLSPRLITSPEIATDYKQVYANYDFPTDFDTMYPEPNAYTFTQNQTVYFLSMQYPAARGPPATRDYKLFRFDEPTAAPFDGTQTGGGFTDATPWGPSTGPNTNAANYQYNTPPTAVGQSQQNFLYYLPTLNQVAIVSKFFSWDQNIDPGPSGTFFDLTYYDITGVSFTYFHAFLTGFITSAGAPLSSDVGAAYVVLGANQVNSFPSHYDFVFSGLDYTKIWLQLTVENIADWTGTPDATLFRTIFVEYQLGGAPTVLRIIPEDGWDAAYAAYGTAIGNTNVVYNSLGGTSAGNGGFQSNSGLYDLATNAFWFGGDSDNIFQLDPYFEGQVALRDTGPFLKLTFSVPTGPITGGKVYNRYGISSNQVPQTPSADDSGGQLDFSKPGNSGLIQ